MNKLILMGGAALLTLSTAAMAQNEAMQPVPDAAAAAPAPADDAAPPAVDPAPASDAAASAAPVVGQSIEPAADAVSTTPPAPAVAQSPAPDAAAATATANADVTAKVQADWAKYDEGNKGKLTALEFGTWMMAAKGEDVTAQVEKTKTSKRGNLPAIKVLNATAADFSKADKDKDRMISPEELAVFLSA